MFTCLLEGNVLWKFNGKHLPLNTVMDVNHKTHQHILTVFDVNPGNGGTYTCSSEVKDHLYFEASGVLVVKRKLLLYSHYYV